MDNSKIVQYLTALSDQLNAAADKHESIYRRSLDLADKLEDIISYLEDQPRV